ncbi:MAG TPA: hypothetical protein VKN99_10905 [Polyangia bacterium]|nr:hypothetical protein [Polyangia bacterium]
MRSAVLTCALLTWAGCRSRAPAPEEPAEAAPSEAPAPEPAPAPAPARRAAPPPEAEEPPPQAAIGRALGPIYADARRCLAATPVTADAGPRRLELRVSIQPSGVVRTVELDGWPPASECLASAVRQVRFPSWRGRATLLTVALERDGAPVPLPPDAGARDGGR